MALTKAIRYDNKQLEIPVQQISNASTEIIERLIDCGYEAYLVGGCIRDLLMGLKPKDFDIATSATPEEVKTVFKKQCRIIGRRFRLAHVYHTGSLYEVATFRGISESGERVVHQGQILRDNVYGTIDQDVLRRDFTCNALYYDVITNEVIDYVGGVEDIKNNALNLIGNATERFTEDPVRMLRSIRFSAKLGLQLSQDCVQSMPQLTQTLMKVPGARLFDEIIKIFHCGYMLNAFELMQKMGLFVQLFPQLKTLLPDSEETRTFLCNAFSNTDQRLSNKQSVTPVFLMACTLWPDMLQHYSHFVSKGSTPYEALHQAANISLEKQREIIAVPRAIQSGIRQIWVMQLRFKRMYGKGVYTTLHHPRFRAAYDFLLLRHSVHPQLENKAEFWTQVQELSPEAIRKRIFGKNVKRKKLSAELM